MLSRIYGQSFHAFGKSSLHRTILLRPGESDWMECDSWGKSGENCDTQSVQWAKGIYAVLDTILSCYAQEYTCSQGGLSTKLFAVFIFTSRWIHFWHIYLIIYTRFICKTTWEILPGRWATRRSRRILAKKSIFATWTFAYIACDIDSYINGIMWITAWKIIAMQINNNAFELMFHGFMQLS